MKEREEIDMSHRNKIADGEKESEGHSQFAECTGIRVRRSGLDEAFQHETINVHL